MKAKSRICFRISFPKFLKHRHFLTISSQADAQKFCFFRTFFRGFPCFNEVLSHSIQRVYSEDLEKSFLFGGIYHIA
jgi:hypothetical protein